MPDAIPPGGPRTASSVPVRRVRISGSWSQSFSVPIEGQEVGFENDGPVPVVEFDYDSLDGAEDLVRDSLRKGVPLRAIIEGLVAVREYEIQCEAVKYVLCEVVSQKHWFKALLELCVACGLADQMGWTQPAIAKRLGISKQALQQGVEKVRQNFGLRKTRMMRDEDARGTMQRRNFRHFNDVNL